MRSSGPAGRDPALDVLRGLAVLAVVAFHAGVPGFGGGFLGVDVFLVLSGYLITSLLLGEAARAGRVRLGRFWWRRATRLLPALAALLVVVATAAPLLLAADALPRLRRDIIAALTFTANWRLVGNGSSYFAATASPSPLEHTWSLAVEEQFYLVWPVLVVILAWTLRRRRGTLRHAVLAAALAGVGASAVTSAVLAGRAADPTRVYVGTDTRASALLVGAALAAALPLGAGTARAATRTTAVRVAALVGLPAAVALGAAIHLFRGDKTWLYPWGLLGTDLAVVALLAAVLLSPRRGSAWAAVAEPLRQLGRISYGVYLWHWPVVLTLTHARSGWTGMTLVAARVVATLLLAVASWYLVEQPTRRALTRVPRPAHRWRLAPPVVATALTVGVAAAAVAFAPPPVVPPTVAVLAAAVPPPQPAVSGPGSRAIPAATPRPRASAVRAHRGPVVVAVAGDSVALTLAAGLPPVAGVRVVSDGILGCGVARGGPYRYEGVRTQPPATCDVWPQTYAAAVARDRPDVVALLAGRWEMADRFRDGRWTRVGDPAYDAYLLSELDRAVDVLSARGARVALLTAPYYLRQERPDGGLWPEDEPARVDHWNQLLVTAAAHHPGTATVVDLGRRITPGHSYAEVVDGIRMRYDGVHLTPQGDRAVGPWLLARLRALAAAPAP